MILLPEVSSLKSQQYVGLLVGATLAMSGVMGPLLGGALTQYADWRWVFWIKCVLSPFFPRDDGNRTDLTLKRSTRRCFRLGLLPSVA